MTDTDRCPPPDDWDGPGFIVEIGGSRRAFTAKFSDLQRAEWLAEDFGTVRECTDDDDPTIVAEITEPEGYPDGSVEAGRIGVIRRCE